jgi:uncharacterized protein YjbI with pentapeptide repeats
MIQPSRAAVRPRVYAPISGETVLLEDEIRGLVEKNASGWFAILGPAGSGKSTAIMHLAAALPPVARIVLLEELPREEVDAYCNRLVVFTTAVPGHVDGLYRLAPWTEDDLIEYLLATHKDRCASVLARVRPADRDLFAGIPDLWQIVLEQLAGDESIPDGRSALHRYLEAHLSDTDLIERARSVCLNALAAPDCSETTALEKLAKPGFAQGLLRALRHHAVRLLLAAERIASDLRGDADCDFLAQRLPRELVRAAATLVVGEERALDHLHRLLAGPFWSHAMAASILHATGAVWVPQPDNPPVLTGAYLEGVRWPEARLAYVELDEADLSGADLCGANLNQATASRCILQRARLRGASLRRLQAVATDLSHADLSSIRAVRANFDGASLKSANLESAVLRSACFVGADLTGADFRGADLSAACLVETVVRDADFSGANLRGARLSGLRLREAYCTGADFSGADLKSCDLEFMELPAARFTGADLTGTLLTGTRIPEADFRAACLCETGLAEIEWERADLRGADLRGASFHLGTTRSGLVGSPIACEGSRTGFYTDDYEEQAYKAPEEIRKANLRGADLRGARLDGVDFYLVDLREGRYDPEQEEHLRGCGAILEARV